MNYDELTPILKQLRKNLLIRLLNRDLNFFNQFQNFVTFLKL